MADASTTGAPAAVELADVFAQHGPAFLERRRLPLRQLKVMQAVVACRTATLGGQRQWCSRCGFERYVYHSCRNRHCPKCQTATKEAWRAARACELLPVPYFHHVFTLPHLLNRLVQWSERNQRALLKLLFNSAAATLLEFGRRTLGGQVGFTLVLHTWDQRLRPHFHLHCLMPSGALAGTSGSSRWIAGGSRFLFPVRGLSKMYRAKFLDGLEQLLERNELDLPPDLGGLTLQQHRRWLRPLRRGPWVVYSKPPFAGPHKLLDYLSRYTHRVAISNHRILSCDDRHVRFSYRDRNDGDRKKVESLPAEEFISRFLQHVLPDRFTRIRHYGFLSGRNKSRSLERIRRLIGAPNQLSSLGEDPNQSGLPDDCELETATCPCCKAPLHTQPLEPIPALGRRLRLPPRGPP